MELDTNLKDKVQELYETTGDFEHLIVYDMDEMDTMLSHLTPSELASKLYFGGYNPNHDYFRFDAYDNIESLRESTLAYELEDERDDIEEAYSEI